jgi:DNA-binding beta-propeller fold protein YncE
VTRTSAIRLGRRSRGVLGAAVWVTLACWLASAQASAAEPAQSGYRVLRTFALGGEGGWDYLAVEPERHRVFVSRSTHVMVIDAESGKVVGDLPGTEGVHGIALAPELGRGFTSNGRAGTATIFDLATLSVIDTVKTGEDPDAILYDRATKRVFTFNGRSLDTTAIDAASGKVVGTLALGGRPEFAVADGSGRIFVDIEDKGEVVALDARALAVVARWPVAPGAEPSGLAYDPRHRRLFAACRNRKLIVLDAESGRVTAELPIGRGVDGAVFDPERGLAFASNADGTLSVVSEEGPGSFALLENAPTAPGARTLALDPVTHLLYLPTARFAPAPQPQAGAPAPRPKPLAGSFEVLVVGK